MDRYYFYWKFSHNPHAGKLRRFLWTVGFCLMKPSKIGWVIRCNKFIRDSWQYKRVAQAEISDAERARIAASVAKWSR